MALYTFSNNKDFVNPIRISFLCGSKYIKEDSKNKRKKLKEYLESLSNRDKVVILEENFTFSKKQSKLFSYRDIGLRNLYDVEMLTALLVDKIFIVHETFSTAAELGMFSTNVNLRGKICVLAPDKHNYEEDVISNFLKLGLWNQENILLSPVIRFLVKPNIKMISETKNRTFTYFNDDNFNNVVSKDVENFLNFSNENLDMRIHKKKLKMSSKNSFYYINSKNKEVIVNLYKNSIKHYIISLFWIPEFTKEFRKTSKIFESINIVEKWFKKILINTIQEREYEDIQGYKFTCKILGIYGIEYRTAIAYTLYLLHAIKFLEFKTKAKHLAIRHDFVQFRNLDSYKSMICKKNMLPSIGGK